MGFFQEYAGIWAFLTAFFTLLLVLVAYIQLRKIYVTNRADFVDRFKKELFNKPAQELIMLLEYSALEFRIHNIEYGEDIPSTELAYFYVCDRIIEQLRSINISISKPVYKDYEIDDNLLGHFEDIGTFEKKGVLDIYLIYNSFSYYILMTWENEEIKKYIDWLREVEENSDIYENYEYIYAKCKSYGEAKRNRKWLWLWKLKWFMFHNS